MRNGWSVLRFAAFCGLGVVISIMGFPFTTWQFWAIVGLASLIQFASAAEND
jgi:hypothetical protein